MSNPGYDVSNGAATVGGNGRLVARSAESANATPVGVPTALRIAASLARGWRTLLGVALTTTAAAMAAAAFLPKSYVAGTLLIPFVGTSARSSLAAAGLPSGVAGLLGGIGASPSERLLSVVLGSGTLFGEVLQRAARTPGEREVVDRVLRTGVRVVRNPDGSLVVQVSAPTPELAARVANTYPPVLNQVLARLSSEGARTKQAFLRAQLDTADDRLLVSERKFIDFAQRRTAPAPEQQANRTIDAAAALQQQIFEQEAAIAQLRRTATPSNPELRAAEALLATRRAQLSELTNGGGLRRSVLVPVERGTELRIASTRVEREYQQDLRVYSSLAASLTDVQIDVGNSLPVLTVLDPATPPGDPTLKVSTAGVLGLAFGLVLGAIVTLVRHELSHLRENPETAPYLEAFPLRARRPAAMRERA